MRGSVFHAPGGVVCDDPLFHGLPASIVPAVESCTASTYYWKTLQASSGYERIRDRTRREAAQRVFHGADPEKTHVDG